MKETEAKIDKNSFSISSSHILDHILQDGKLANNDKTKKFNDQHLPLVMVWRTEKVKNSLFLFVNIVNIAREPTMTTKTRTKSCRQPLSPILSVVPNC